ncbi:MAG TPA: MASE1 domain-containing protein [Candidatus Paceibacterota bacterium]
MQHYRHIALLALVFFAYTATGLWGLELSPVGGFATLVWPPTGIALAALYFGGLRLTPAIALAAFATNIVTGAPILAAFGIALGNTLEILAGVYILRSPENFNPLFRRLRDTLHFLVVSGVAPLIAATIGVTSLVLTGVMSADQFLVAWIAWWLGDTLGILVLGAFLIRWIAKPFFRRAPLEWAKIAVTLGALAGANVLAVINPIPILAEIPFIYFFIPFLTLSLLEGSRMITLASLVVAAFTIWNTVHGIGIFADKPIPQNLFLAQLLLGSLAMIFLVIASTMEERRQANIALQNNLRDRERALQRVRRADHAKNEFIAILAHELRNPLAPIVSSLELLGLDKNESAEHREARETMAGSVAVMRRLLDDLLDISRISRRGFKLQKERVDLIAVVKNSVKSAESFVRERGHTFTVAISGEAISVNADPMRIEQVVVNLLNNAAKYTNVPGIITVSCEVQKKDAVITITDTGIGISPERLPYIFEPFQEPAHPQMRREGIGIGLSLSARLIKLHGGTIEAASKGEGVGSTFTIRIPLSHSNQMSVPLIPRPKKHGVPAALAFDILLVDDNAAAAESLGTLLSALGHTIQTAATGKEALDLFEVFHADVAIIDIGLPDIDGYRVAERARKGGFEGTLVALTGYGQDEDKAKAYAAGFNHHLTKPASLSDINAVFEKIALATAK